VKKMRILHDISFKLKVISAWWDFAEFPGSDVVIWSGDELKAARFERVDELKSRRPRKYQYRLTTLQIAYLELRVAMSVT